MRDLPEPIASAVQPLFAALPLDVVMEDLTPAGPRFEDDLKVVERVLAEPAIGGAPELEAGLWLYVDALDRSHTVSQGIDNQTGSFWHGIMHRREGDFSNSHYWFRRVGRHPAMNEIPGYDGHAFIDEVEAAQPENPAALVETQRAEWAALFAWCARQAAG
jgi:hypothetical protein